MPTRLELRATLASQHGPVHGVRTRVGEQGQKNMAGRTRGCQRGGDETGRLLSGKRASVNYVMLLCT